MLLWILLSPFIAFAQVQPVALGLLLVNGKVLLLERSAKEKQYSGYFSLPGGQPEAGESAAAAVVREFREETGLEVRVIRIYNHWGWTSKGIYHDVTSFLVELIGPANVTLSHEHTDYYWADSQHLRAVKISDELYEDLLIGFGFNQPSAEVCARILNRGSSRRF